MTALEIRTLQDADVPSLISLWHACDLLRPWNDPVADIAKARQSAGAETFVGLCSDAIVASTMAGDDGHRGWLYYVAVHPDHRRGGFGRQIVEAAENWLAARGREKSQLMIRADNAAVRGFYASLGYGEQARIIMARWLDGRPLTP